MSTKIRILILCLIVAAVVLLVASCAQPQPADAPQAAQDKQQAAPRAEVAPGTNAMGDEHASAPLVEPSLDRLDALIEASQSPDRCEWWPAVQELGQLAASDPALRDEMWSRAHVNTLGMKFVRVEPGSFTMGPDAHFIFQIQWAHPVEITRPYYICVTEVTNAQYRMIVPTYDGNARYSPEPDCPAVGIAWIGAERFCEQLSDREAAHYRLPTEAEWEYACRAGTNTRYCFGNFWRPYGEDRLSDYAWWNYENGHASEVALLLPNDWGIYDMHGNAWEWAADWYSDTYYRSCLDNGTVADPVGPADGHVHVLRGGGWQVRNQVALSSTVRCPLPTFDRRPWRLSDFLEVGLRQTIGFRVVRDVENEEP